MSAPPPEPPAEEPRAAGSGTGEQASAPPVHDGPSPWSREYSGPSPSRVLGPDVTGTPGHGPDPEPRFAGRPYSTRAETTLPPGSPPPGHLAPPGYPAPEPGFGLEAGRDFPAGQPEAWQQYEPADPPLAGLTAEPWPPSPPGPASRRGLLALLLVLALVAATVTTVAVTSSAPRKTAAPNVPATGPLNLPTLPPGLAPTPGPSSQPGQSLGQIPTPPGLAAIDYHAYALEQLAPADIALGPAEEVQFKRYGLSRIVSLRALTLGASDSFSDDYDATINVLRFADSAGARAELDYSNAQNKKTSPIIALPGVPGATGFLNADAGGTGVSVGAFTTLGRYQVVVILGGLGQAEPTDGAVVAAEAARVLRAVLPDAAGIVPPTASGGSGGTTPAVPAPGPTTNPAPSATPRPTPSPTGTRA